jgi:hypothetical protein
MGVASSGPRTLHCGPSLARSLSQLARTLDTLGDLQAARQYRQQALEILETLGDDQADALRELMNSHGDRAD